MLAPCSPTFASTHRGHHCGAGYLVLGNAIHSFAHGTIGLPHSWCSITVGLFFTLMIDCTCARDYAKLRLSAASESLASLRAERPAANNDPIDKQRSWRISVALLRFNFDHSDLIRWLGGEYTNAFCNWETAFDIIDTVRHHKVPPGYPPVDFNRAFRACTASVPLAGIFECSRSSTWSRER
jgi:hypothetical protein